MANTKQKDERKKIFVCALILLVLLGAIIVWLIEHSTSTGGKQVVNHLPVGQTESKSQRSKPRIENKEVAGEIADNDELAQLENLPLPSPFTRNLFCTSGSVCSKASRSQTQTLIPERSTGFVQG